MEEKKRIKISFVLVLVIIILLIVGLGFLVYTNNKKTDNNSSENNTVTEENKEDTKTTDYFILYNGSEIEKKTGIQYLDYVELSEENKKKYNIEYYNYEKGQLLGTADGELGEEIYENCTIIKNVARIATSIEYDIVPRLYIDTTEIPEELMRLSNYSSVNMRNIDLDGDGTDEHIVCCTLEATENEQNKADTNIILYDSNYQIISELLTMDGTYNGGKEFLSLDDIDCVDIDNDGNMEILIYFPVYEGLGGLSIYRYSNGSLEGASDYHVTLNP